MKTELSPDPWQLALQLLILAAASLALGRLVWVLGLAGYKIVLLVVG